MIWCEPMRDDSRTDQEMLKRSDEIWQTMGMDLPDEYVYEVDDDDVFATATTPNASYEGDPETVFAMMLINYDQSRHGFWTTKKGSK